MMNNLILIIVSVLLAFVIGVQMIYARNGQKVNYFIATIGFICLPFDFVRVGAMVYKEIKKEMNIKLFSYKNLILLLFSFVEIFPSFFVMYVKFWIEFQKRVQSQSFINDVEKTRRIDKYRKDQKDLFEKGLVA